MVSIKGVIFDLDGTLADTLPDLADAVNVGLASRGYPERDTDEIRGWIGDGMRNLCVRAIRGGDSQPSPESDESLLGAIVEAVNAHYRAHRLDKTVLYPGIEDLLDGLVERNIAMGVLSNKPAIHTVPMVAALLGGWPWVAVEGSQDGRPRKPDPGVAREMLSKIGAHPSEVLMVGDSAIDIQTGLNAGMRPVGVSWGFRARAELIEAGAWRLVDTSAELLALI